MICSSSRISQTANKTGFIVSVDAVGSYDFTASLF